MNFLTLNHLCFLKQLQWNILWWQSRFDLLVFYSGLLSLYTCVIVYRIFFFFSGGGLCYLRICYQDYTSFVTGACKFDVFYCMLEQFTVWIMLLEDFLKILNCKNNRMLCFFGRNILTTTSFSSHGYSDFVLV